MRIKDAPLAVVCVRRSAADDSVFRKKSVLLCVREVHRGLVIPA